MHACLWGRQQSTFHTATSAHLQISVLKAKWTDWVQAKWRLFFNTFSRSFAPLSEQIFIPISRLFIKDFKHFCDYYLIRGEHGSYSSKRRRITIFWIKKWEADRDRKGPKPQTTLLCSEIMELAWLLFFLVKKSFHIEVLNFILIPSVLPVRAENHNVPHSRVCNSTYLSFSYSV